VKTDASAFGVCACLLQGEGEHERPIEFASRLLSPAEKNYSTTEQKALAVVYALQKFRGYVEGSPIVVISDHQPLWLLTLKTPSGCLARWALWLQSFDLQVDYAPGRTDVLADILSRSPTSESAPNIEIGLAMVTLPTVSAKVTKQLQLGDVELRPIIESLEEPFKDDVDHTRWTERGHVMCHGILYRYAPYSDTEEAQLVVPQLHVPACTGSAMRRSDRMWPNT
jgi:hypothetical protein